MTASGHGRRFGTMRACFSTPLVSRPSPGETDRPLGAFRTPAARACGGLVTAGVRKPAQRRASHVPDPSPLAHISRRSRETRLPLEPAFSLESDLIQMPVSAGSFMERHRFGNSDLMISAIGLGCYGMSEVYGPADDAESIATIRRGRGSNGPRKRAGRLERFSTCRSEPSARACCAWAGVAAQADGYRS